MYRIVRKEALRPTVTLYEIEAPLIAKKAQPGQFIILRVDTVSGSPLLLITTIPRRALSPSLSRPWAPPPRS